MRTLTRRIALTCTALGAAILTGSAVADPGSRTVPGPVPDPYRASIRRALDRAQRELERSTILYVDHSSWTDPWRVSTDHYEVRTTHSRFLALDVARGLEVMLQHFANVLGTEVPAAEPRQVLIHPSRTEYNAFGETHGAEHSSFYGSFFPNGHPERPVATYYTENPTLLRMWITHGALHQFLDRAYPQPPPTSIAEGLASYFALFWDFSYGARELERIVAQGQFVPLSRLLNDPIGQYVDRPDARLIELGMLVNYLLNYREDTRTIMDGEVLVQEPFAEYLRLVLRGADVSHHPVHELITEGIYQLETDFQSFNFPR